MHFVSNQPAIFHQNALILGDTHFGIEEKFKRQGIFHSGLSMLLLEQIKKLLNSTKATKLILLGDVKENINYVDQISQKILLELDSICDLSIVRGNHDGGIEKICKKVFPSSGCIYKNLSLIHGNAWPSEALMQSDYLVAAHQHPILTFVDKLGKAHSNQAWAIYDLNYLEAKKYYKKINKNLKLISIPAFNPFVGYSINKREKTSHGPLFSNNIFDLQNGFAYSLQGQILGKISDFLI